MVFTESANPMIVELLADEHPYAFRDPALFKNVSRLVIQQANGIACFGNAVPVLALPSRIIRLLELRSDLFVSEFPRPELPIIASVAKREWKGRIVAVNAGLTHDAYTGMLGETFPGITAADNEQFAKNVLRTIALGQPSREFGWQDVFRLISEIEMRLARTTNIVLSRVAGEDWFSTCVLSGVKEKCHERLQHEQSGFPASAYLDLIDYKRIWSDQWVLFGKLMLQLDPAASKTNSLRFIQGLNDLRKPAMHPSKRYYAGLPPPDHSIENELRQYAQLAQSMEEVAAKPLH